jgi:hypothetical protein
MPTVRVKLPDDTFVDFSNVPEGVDVEQLRSRAADVMRARGLTKPINIETAKALPAGVRFYTNTYDEYVSEDGGLARQTYRVPADATETQRKQIQKKRMEYDNYAQPFLQRLAERSASMEGYSPGSTLTPEELEEINASIREGFEEAQRSPTGNWERLGRNFKEGIIRDSDWAAFQSVSTFLPEDQESRITRERLERMQREQDRRAGKLGDVFPEPTFRDYPDEFLAESIEEARAAYQRAQASVTPEQRQEFRRQRNERLKEAAKDLGRYEGIPDSKGVLETVAAGVGRLGAQFTSPTNLLAGAATTARAPVSFAVRNIDEFLGAMRALRAPIVEGAKLNAATVVASEPFVQLGNVAAARQDDVDPLQAATNIGLGVLAGGAFEGLGRAISGLVDLPSDILIRKADDLQRELDASRIEAKKIADVKQRAEVERRLDEWEAQAERIVAEREATGVRQQTEAEMQQAARDVETDINAREVARETALLERQAAELRARQSADDAKILADADAEIEAGRLEAETARVEAEDLAELEASAGRAAARAESGGRLPSQMDVREAPRGRTVLGEQEVPDTRTREQMLRDARRSGVPATDLPPTRVQATRLADAAEARLAARPDPLRADVSAEQRVLERLPTEGGVPILQTPRDLRGAIPASLAGRNLEGGFMSQAIAEPVAGALIGYQFGETEDERKQNALIGGGLGFGAGVLRGRISDALSRRASARNNPVEMAKATAELPPPSVKPDTAAYPTPLQAMEGNAPTQKPRVVSRQEPPITGKEEKSRFSERVKNDTETPPPVAAKLDATYNAVRNPEVMAVVDARLAKQGAENETNRLLATKNPDVYDMATALRLIDIWSAEKNFDMAAALADHMSEVASSYGQAIQILSLFRRTDPMDAEQLAKALARRVSKQTGEVIEARDMKPREKAEYEKMVKRSQETTDAELKLTYDARAAEIMRSLIPADKATKIRAFLNLAMLLNPKTQIRNVLGNSVAFVTYGLADVAAPIIDMAASRVLPNGKRTRTYAALAERAKQTKNILFFDAVRGDFMRGYRGAESWNGSLSEALSEGLQTVRIRSKLQSAGKIDFQDAKNSLRRAFSNPFMQALEDGLTIALGVGDRGFWQAQYEISLRNQMSAARLNGQSLSAPDGEMLIQAVHDANRAIYMDENIFSKAFNETRKGLNWASTAGQSKNIGVGQVVLPFSQVPGSLLYKSLEFSPFGFFKAGWELIRPNVWREGGAVNQRRLVDALANASGGTVGLFGVGYLMHRLGIISAAPDDDYDVEAARKAMGWGGYRMNLSAFGRVLAAGPTKAAIEAGKMHAGDLVVNYDWAEPTAFALALGAQLSEEQEQLDRLGKRGSPKAQISALATSAGAGAKTLFEQPLLQGLTNFVGSVIDAARGRAPLTAPVATLTSQALTQPIPTLVGQGQQMMDNRLPETRGGDPMESFTKMALARPIAKVMGVTEALGIPAKRDVLGRVMERYQNGGNGVFNVFFNPAFATRIKDDPVLGEAIRIYENTGRAEQMPRAVRASVMINGVSERLSGEQVAAYQQTLGVLTDRAMQGMITTERYQNADDETRATMAANAIKVLNSATTIALLGSRPGTISRDVQDVVKYMMQDDQLGALVRSQPVNNLGAAERIEFYANVLGNQKDPKTRETWLAAQVKNGFITRDEAQSVANSYMARVREGRRGEAMGAEQPE